MATDKLMNTYGTRNLSLVRGEGSWVWDDQGNRYLDAFSGVAVCNLGHAHPAVTQALANQAATLVHCSNHYRIPVQEKLADTLCQLSGMDKVFFGNSGAEANEAAIKIARLYGHSRGIDVPTVVVTKGAFHGRTLATLTATGNRKVQAGFEPLVRGFTRAPFNDADALETIAANNADVCALLVEPIQGEGGVQVPSPDYLGKLRTICDRHGWLLMLDEIQTGNGRTGSFFNYQQHGLLPDIVTNAKALANGVPIGACLASGVAADLMQPGSHGSTFGGNPLACAAALATVDTLVREDLCDRAAVLGAHLLQQFTDALKGNSRVKAVRGAGLMIGIELDGPCKELTQQAAEKGLLINVTADSVIRLLPPLIFSDEQAEQLVETLCQLL